MERKSGVADECVGFEDECVSFSNIHLLKATFANDAFAGGDYEEFSNIVKIYSEKVEKLKIYFIKKYGKNQIVISKFKWQKSYHDHIIRNAKDFENHRHYTIYNFQKHNLPESWKYTSLNYDRMVDGIEL